MKYKYLSAEQVIGIYQEICKYWNQPIWEILNFGALETALFRPQNAANFEKADLIRQAAYLLHGLVQAHAFVDANKRVAYLTTELFLRENGFKVKDLPDGDLSDLVLGIAKGSSNLDKVEDWLRTRVIPA